MSRTGKARRSKGGISINVDLDYGEVLILGCGNLLKGDDGFGVEVVTAMREGCELPPNVKLIDTGTSGAYLVNLLNHYMDHPKVLVVVDSGDFRGEFGELRFFSADDLKVLSDGFSIHTWPLPNELARYKGDVHILLCQIMEPDNDSFRLGLSPKISDSVRKACDMLYDLIGVNT